MKRRLEPSLNIARIVTAASVVLADWYALHSTIRRLWAMENSQGIRVIVALEPTHDGDDTSPTWFANCDAWAIELRTHLDRSVLLERIEDSSLEEIESDGNGVVVADLSWRDPCMFAI